MTERLAAASLSAGYGDVPVVAGIDLHVDAGEVVALLGPNGAGKTTTLLSLAGELRPMSGEVRWRGKPTTAPVHRRCRDGLAFVTEERSVFMELTAAQNLRLGRCDSDAVLRMFPELTDHLRRRAGLLSGGQQQILTLARALAREPHVLLADELSLGLAPLVVQRLLKAIRDAADRGVGVLLVEQHVRKALNIADRVYVMHGGSITFEGTAAEARENLAEIEAGYLAVTR